MSGAPTGQDADQGTAPGSPEESRTDAPGVAFVGIDMSYDTEPILRNITFDVRPGSTTVVMGPSGVGKTTLMKALLGLREPDEGDVLVGGRSVVDATPAQLKEIRRNFGVLLGGSMVHDGSIFGSMTAWENVRYPLEARGYDKAAVERRAWQRMIEFDLTEHHHLKPDALSGGLRRRLGLARAFVDDPTLLILDDPGTALDLANREKIVESIRRARASTHATVVLTCHDIRMAKALGDDLVVLVAGRVGAQGPAAELLDGVDDAADYDARFSIRANLDEDSAESIALYKADRDFRDLLDRLAITAMIVLGLVSLAGIIIVVTVTMMTVWSPR